MDKNNYEKVKMNTSQLQSIVKDLNMRTLCKDSGINYNNLLYRLRINADLKTNESELLIKTLTNLRDKLNSILEVPKQEAI